MSHSEDNDFLRYVLTNNKINTVNGFYPLVQPAWFFLSSRGRQIVGVRDSHKAVSYTHLDVYKRQAQRSGGTRGGRSIGFSLQYANKSFDFILAKENYTSKSIMILVHDYSLAYQQTTNVYS